MMSSMVINQATEDRQMAMTTIQRVGNTAATVVRFGDTEVLFSYETPVAAFIPGRGYIKTDRFFSVTTSRHINKYINLRRPGNIIGEAVKVSQDVLTGLTIA
jgi:hypothetical protein